MQRFPNMQMQSSFGRGFGGPPQPQRQGGRRGRGNFRGNGNNSRFDQPQQRHGQGSNNQRPSENKGVIVIDDDSQKNNPAPQKPVQQQPAKPQQPQQPAKPQQQQQQQQTPKPLLQQQLAKPAQPQQQPAQQKPSPQNQAKPQQNQVQTPQKPDAKVDKPATESNQGTKRDFNSEPKQQNGNFASNKQGGIWAQGNRQGGGSFGQGNQGNRQSSGSFSQGTNQGNERKPFSGPGPARNQRNNFMRGPQQGGSNEGGQGGPKVGGGMREEQMLAHKLKELVGPLTDLPHLNQEEVMFNGRSRLYIGNISADLNEEGILAMFAPYGQTSELFLNKEKNFGFIKLDYRVNAEKAKRELDGKLLNGRTLRVRFAPHNSAVRVKNIPPFVSNELLYCAFEIFGKIERAYVKVDDRGKSLGEGVVEFSRKPSALAAIRNCTDKCFFLTSSLRPVIVENFEEPDELDGYQEKNLPRKHPEFIRSREIGPRFSEAGSFEHEYGTRWKQLHEMHRKKEETLRAELSAEEEKLEAQMEYAKYEHETELLRAQLRQREQDRERQQRSWEMAERAADERREQDRVALQRQGDELATRMRLQDDELRRRQKENTLFVQAQRLGSLLDRADSVFEGNPQPMDGAFRDQFDMGVGYDDVLRQQKHGWEGPRQVDEYPNKRRRY